MHTGIDFAVVVNSPCALRPRDTHVMSPRENSVGLPSRRRPSLSLRPRTRTAAPSIALSKDNALDQWRETYVVKICQDHHAPVVEDMEHFPEAVPRRRAAKSFSSLRHPMDGIVALGRRLSVSIRSKSSKQNLRVPGEEEKNSECGHYNLVSGHPSHKRNVTSGSWGLRSRDWTNGVSINRRPSLNSVSALHGFYAPTASTPVPIPGHGLKPPVLPNDMYAGSAARAAAAAQNERMELARLDLAKAERDIHKSDTRVTQDSESGIGIDLRDLSDHSDIDLNIVRIGKNHEAMSVISLQELMHAQTRFPTCLPRS